MTKAQKDKVIENITRFLMTCENAGITPHEAYYYCCGMLQTVKQLYGIETQQELIKEIDDQQITEWCEAGL